MCLAQIAVLQSFSRFEKFLTKKRRLLMLTAMITGVGFVVLGLARWAPIIIAFIPITAGFGLSRTPLFISYMNKFIPSDKRATILSVTSMLRTLGICTVNFIAGFLSDWSMNYMLAIVGVVIIILATATKVKEEFLID